MYFIICDFDNTLCYTSDIIIESYEQAFNMLGLSCRRNIIEHYVKYGLSITPDVMTAISPSSKDLYQHIKDKKNEILLSKYSEIVINNSVFSKLNGNNFNLLSSNGTRSIISKLLDKLGCDHLFLYTVFCNELPFTKFDPEYYDEINRKFNVNKLKPYVIDDNYDVLLAAKSSHIDPILEHIR